jgi:predicted unusual protein kinase regulating ubiquinone biosynthesis (AarF/ABC1/UbiB family)
MLPVELCHVLRRLRSDAPSHSAEFTRRSIEEDFCAQGREWPFASFDPVPIASGTVGQVHRATVRESGQVVAVKVLHPNVEEQLDMDIGILFGAARIISRLPYMSWARIPVGVEEVRLSFCIGLRVIFAQR